MKIQKTILNETKKIAVGTLALTMLMVLVFALLGRLTGDVWLGALLGAAAGILDFFLLGITVQQAAEYQAAHPLPKQEEPEEEKTPDETADGNEKYTPADPETAAYIKKKVQLSHLLRRAMLLCFAATGLTPFVNLLAVVVPMLFPKIVIQVLNLSRTLPGGGNQVE